MEHCLQGTTYIYGHNAKLRGYENIILHHQVMKLAQLYKVKCL
jgi:hypothetical protein